MAATKKSAPKPDVMQSESGERVVDIKVPAVKGVPLNEIKSAALMAVRNEIPNRSDLVKEVLDETEKEGDHRVYHVKISWGPREDSVADDDEDTVAQELAALKVPTAMPAIPESG